MLCNEVRLSFLLRANYDLVVIVYYMLFIIDYIIYGKSL